MIKKGKWTVPGYTESKHSTLTIPTLYATSPLTVCPVRLACVIRVRSKLNWLRWLRSQAWEAD